MLAFLDLALQNSGQSFGKPSRLVSPVRPPCFHLTYRQWEIANLESSPSKFDFPPFDLVTSLIPIYFEHVNNYLPLLHRPTFEKCVLAGLHFRDEAFGITVLLVCAIAARHSDDPRVLLEGHDKPGSRLSAGWKWFNQTHMMKRSILLLPSLHELQYFAVCTALASATLKLIFTYSLQFYS